MSNSVCVCMCGRERDRQTDRKTGRQRENRQTGIKKAGTNRRRNKKTKTKNNLVLAELKIRLTHQEDIKDII